MLLIYGINKVQKVNIKVFVRILILAFILEREKLEL